jgi:Tfp pilus assembly protein PilP
MILRPLLALFAVGAAGLYCWRAWTQPPVVLPELPPAAATVVEPPVVTAPTATEHFWTAQLFHFPDTPEPEPVFESEPIDAAAFLVPRIRLVGIVDIEGSSTAIIVPEEGASPMRVRSGAAVGIWRVVAVERRAIVLENDMQALRFEIGRSSPTVLPLPGGENVPPAAVRIIPMIEDTRPSE